ncbi:hypothetical protein AB0E69_03280 [Kribbella sp. NPDC026611]|uniref:hypothetical protein n=1 Tax=Kribbella sp. NPDC026611 TaxID=3154911 RepID=UPI0033F3F44E
MFDPAPEHWSARAGLRPGRSFYSWHIDFAAAPQIVALHASYADLLHRLPDFTPMPLQRMFLDVQGIGFADRVPDQDLAGIVEATRRRLTDLGAIPVTVGPAVLRKESIQLPVRPVAPLQHLRELTQAAIVDVWGDDAIPERPDLDPHLTLAYSNNITGTAAVPLQLPAHSPYSTALSISAVTLLSITYTGQVYEWTPSLTLAW